MDARRELFEFVLDQAEAQPLAKRARLYRALAEFAGEPKLTSDLQSLAGTIERGESLHRELALQFQTKPPTHDGQ